MASDLGLAARQDPKAKLVWIFVGAVLLPSAALSVVSFNSIPKQAEATKITLRKRADRVLFYVEEDLERLAQGEAQEAARLIGWETLLEGRPEAIRAALRPAGMGDAFDSLKLEASSHISKMSHAAEDRRDIEALKDALGNQGPGSGEEAIPVSDSEMTGVLRFRYSCGYAHGKLIRSYFDKEFANPDQAMVVRVTEPNGDLLYENLPTPRGDFEVQRTMTSVSFRGLKLFLRYRDRSIQEEVRRWAIAKTVLIVFIDLMLGAGLMLVYWNVEREVHLSKLKSDFVANVSHELKTPLALIRLFSETLELGRVQTDEKVQEYYRVINKESRRLTQLINNILDFSRIEAGKKEYRFAPTDLSKIVSEVIESYRFQTEQHGFTLDVQIADDTPEVVVDKEAISQALLNLLNNAIKYSRQEKTIRVELKPEGDHLLLSVADRGIGIAKAEQRKIFEKFYRAENSLVHETKGSGLGLSLVKHIAEAHGGEVRVESALGKGSTFTILLPIRGPRDLGGSTT